MKLPLVKLVEVLKQINFLHVLANGKEPHHDDELDSPDDRVVHALRKQPEGDSAPRPKAPRPPPRK